MVTSLVLFDPRAAHRAEGHVVFVLVRPACKLPFHGLFASHILSVPLVATLEADLRLALVASQFLGVFAISPKMDAAAGVDAPTNQRIGVELLLVLELAKLLDQVMTVLGL